MEQRQLAIPVRLPRVGRPAPPRLFKCLFLGHFASPMVAVLRQYSDIRRLGRSSDFLVLVGGGIVFVFGFTVSLLDFIQLQHSTLALTVASVLGILLLLLGTAFRGLARWTLRVYWSPVVRVLPEHKLVTRGLYRHIRHPGYLGEILIYLAVPVFLSSAYGAVAMLLILPLILYRIRVEERMMTEKFGDDYRRYSKATKRLVPYLY